jgi:subtilisin family serine protease
VFSILGIASFTLCLQGSAESHRHGEQTFVGYIVVLSARVPSESVQAVSRQIVEAAKTAIPSLRPKQRGPQVAASSSSRPAKEDVVFRNALKGFAVRISADDSDKLEYLERHPDVAFVAEDRPVQLHAQVFQAGMERIRARKHRLTGINGIYDLNMDVDIAILDTGIDAAHPDLNVYQSVSFVSGDATPVDAHGHGTHVAGIAAAIDDDNGIYGVAPGARLWAVKVVDQYGNGDLSDVLSGLDYVVANADQIDVVNISLGILGIGDDGNCGATIGDPLHQATCNVVDAGVVVVVSAGNYVPFGADASRISPASYDEVITVSAVIETDGLGPGAGQGAGTVYGADNSFARTFSNYGWDVDIAAPGVEVISTSPGGGYSAQTGTSMAAPHVAGAAAVWIARNGKPENRDDVFRVRDELVRLAFPQFGSDEGFSGDKETFAEPLLNVAALDPAVFDPVEPRLSTDKPVYEYERDLEAIISVHLKNEHGLPLNGIPSNGFRAYLGGRQKEVQFEEQGQGSYVLTLNIESLLPGDYDFTALISNVSGFERSAGCRIVVQNPVPRILIHEFSFVWPVMNHDSFFSTNPLHAALMDEKGAPLVVPLDDLRTTFSGGTTELFWSFPAPDFSTGVIAGITYGAYQTAVSDVHSLPLGTYFADLTVTHGELSDSATASFDMAYPEPALAADLSSNLSSYDFTQTIAPPALNVGVEVKNEWSTGVAGLVYLSTDPLTLKIDGQVVADVSFAEDLLNAGTYLAHDVDISTLSNGPHELLVHVTDSRGLEVDSNLVTIDVVRETHPCSDPLAANDPTDTDGDGVRDECDNCPTVSNRSQRNSYSGDISEAGLGDACKAQANLQVSSDMTDNPDFFTIQDAVDEAIATPLGVQIDIMPGAGTYSENVVVDRGQSFRFVGRDLGSGPPIIEHSGSGNGVFELRSAGASPVMVRNLVIRGQGVGAGQRGISVDPDMSTQLSDLRFEQLGYGLYLQIGSHQVERVTMDATVGTGVLSDNAALTLRYGEFRGVARAMEILGPSALTEVEHLLVVGNGTGHGIANDSTPSSALELRHSTLTNCGTAVSGNAGATTIAHSILWDNQSDVGGVPCVDITWSDVQDVACGGSNRSVDPLFVNPAAGDYHLQATSPLLEHGPDPSNYAGLPCMDLDGQPRLRDHDGENLAQVDPGAYERENSAITPREVTGLVWTGKTTLEWNPQPTALEYHAYRAPLSTLESPWRTPRARRVPWASAPAPSAATLTLARNYSLSAFRRRFSSTSLG